MKVVETLFVKYMNMEYHQYVDKYLSAKALIDLTENEESETYKNVCEWRDQIHPDCPMSVFRAVRFLDGNETKITIVKGEKELHLNKNQGDDYKLVDWLGDFIDRLDKAVVKSMEGYNTDRSRMLERFDPDSDEILGLVR